MAKKKAVRLCREDLVGLLVNQYGMSKVEARLVLGSLFGEIAREAQNGNSITVRGFGRFAAREGGGFTRNGVFIPRRRRLIFTPAQNQRVKV